MRSRRYRSRATAGVAAAVGLVTLLGIPAVLAAPGYELKDGWEDTTIDPPLATGSATLTSTDTFNISGNFVFGGTVASVFVDTGRLEGNTFVDADDDDCVPEDPGWQQDGAFSSAHQYPFDTGPVTWPCNGVFGVKMEATSALFNTQTLVAEVRMAVPPVPVTAVDAALSDAQDEDPTTHRIEVSWAPLTGADLAPDALGYRVHRWGPMDADENFPGPTVVGADIPEGETPSAVDTLGTPGTYRYVVHALRSGPDGPVLSPLVGSDVAQVTTPDAPPTTTGSTTDTTAGDGSTTTTDPTSTTAGGSTGTSIRPTRPGLRTPRPPAGASSSSGSATQTTFDPGFDETLDYSRLIDQQAQASLNELAGQEEGQSIIRTEGDDNGMMAPVAGALVLLGWAGHVAYINRLAKEF